MRIAVLTNTIASSGIAMSKRSASNGIAMSKRSASNGGAGRIASIYNALLEERGHVVRVWGPNATFEQLKKMNPISRLAFHLIDLGCNNVTAREITEWKPDVLLTHNLTGCGFGTPKTLTRAGIRWVHVLHDVQLIEPSGQIRVDNRQQRTDDRKQTVICYLLSVFFYFWRRSWSLLRHAAMGDPDVVVSPTKWLLEFHRGYGWFRSIKTAVIPNPMAAGGWQLAARNRSNPQMPYASCQLLFVGRVDADKGILVLLEAWKKITMPNAHLVVIGDGTLLDHLRAQHIPRVEFRGVQSSEDVRRAMKESAVVVVPSLILENQPTVILEALASGCNVIASDIGGVAETLDGAGILVPSGDSDALADGIRKIIDNRYRLRSTVYGLLSHHDPNACVSRLLDVLRKL